MGAPPALRPMLIGAVGVAADATDRLVEPKWDGVRAIATIDAGRLMLTNRNGGDVTAAYPELQPPPQGRMVLDGEVVAIDTAGRASFGLLQRRMHVRRPAASLLEEVPVTFMAFDLLWSDGQLLIDRPLAERRQRLEDAGIEHPGWAVTPALDLAPESLEQTGRDLGLEGFVFKRHDSTYQPGRRSSAWAKLKLVRRREFVVGGWLEGRDGRVGSLALGVWDGEPRRLRFVGMAGSGLRVTDSAAFRTAVCDLERSVSPFDVGVAPRGVRYLEPLMVAEVMFSEVTEAGTLRHPVLVGFRTDTDPESVIADHELR